MIAAMMVLPVGVQQDRGGAQLRNGGHERIVTAAVTILRPSWLDRALGDSHRWFVALAADEASHKRAEQNASARPPAEHSGKSSAISPNGLALISSPRVILSAFVIGVRG